jgi:hypothetical protein
MKVKHKKLTLKEKVEAIKMWQQKSTVGVLMCKDVSHGKLTPKEVGGTVSLTCTECGRTQNWVPTEIYDSYAELKYSIKQNYIGGKFIVL